MISVMIDGVEYAPKQERQAEKPQVNQQLYFLLDQLRTDIGKFSENLQKPRLQNDVDELERLAAMANRAVGIVIGTSR
jgi:hypothetical protein